MLSFVIIRIALYVFMEIRENYPKINIKYYIFPKKWDRRVWANNIDQNQMPNNVAPDYGLHCLPLIQYFYTINRYSTGHNASHRKVRWYLHSQNAPWCMEEIKFAWQTQDTRDPPTSSLYLSRIHVWHRLRQHDHVWGIKILRENN